MACCDADYKFTHVDIGAYGHENDAGIFRRSEFGQQILEEKFQVPAASRLPNSDITAPFFFVGDEAFPLRCNLMRPYPGQYLDVRKRIFNYRLSRARRVIENTFGILASRWRIFRQPITCSIETVNCIIMAAVSLHNFLRCEQSQHYCPSNLVDSYQNADGEITSGDWRQIVSGDTNLQSTGNVSANNHTQNAATLRDTMAEYLMSNVGSVHWQEKYINRS